MPGKDGINGMPGAKGDAGLNGNNGAAGSPGRAGSPGNRWACFPVLKYFGLSPVQETEGFRLSLVLLVITNF